MTATIITMPDSLYSFSSMRFNITTRNAVTDASIWNPSIGIDGPSYARWNAQLTFTPREDSGDDDLDDLDQFLSLLKGGLVLCRIYDLRRVGAAAGAGGVTTVVNIAADAAAGATAVTLKNLIASQAVSIRKMQQLGIAENLYRAQYSGPSDGDGEGTFEIWPPLRKGVAVDDAVNLSKPTGIFRIQDGQDNLTILPSMISDSLSTTFAEVPQFA